MSLQMHGLTVRAALTSLDGRSAKFLAIHDIHPIRHGCDISDGDVGKHSTIPRRGGDADESESEEEAEELQAGHQNRHSGRTASPMHEKVPCSVSASYVAPIEEDMMWIVEYSPVEAGFRCPVPFMVYVEHTNADGDELFRRVNFKDPLLRRQNIELGRLAGEIKGHLYAFSTSASTTTFSIYLGLASRRNGRDVQWADSPCHKFKLLHIEGDAQLTGEELSLQTNSQSIPPVGLDEGVQVDQRGGLLGSSPGKRKRTTDDEINVSALLQRQGAPRPSDRCNSTATDVEPVRASLERTVIELSSTTNGSGFLEALDSKEQVKICKVRQAEEDDSVEEQGFLPRRTAAQLAALEDDKAQMARAMARAHAQDTIDDEQDEDSAIVKPEMEQQRRRADQANSGKSILEKCLRDEADKHQRLRKIWARQGEIPDAKAEEKDAAIRRHTISMENKEKKHQAHLRKIDEKFEEEQQHLNAERERLQDEWEQAKLDVRATRSRFNLPDVTPVVDLLADDSGDEERMQA
ncbi:hypothetical protein CBOM_05773 [Ceraceosorus bombacis]|uniref:Uncharacterized protein n=1 Tax=Ceraceosorus bombacis TaxID=401625 RepID=A0A0N7LBD7_9BASI|nr:hypothetical protein CBOM_05773 [Ceraceosorus bombacis]